MEVEVAELLNRIRFKRPFTTRLDTVIIEQYSLQEYEDMPNIEPLPPSPPATHLDVLHSWLVLRRDAQENAPSIASVTSNVKLLIASLSSFLWASMEPEIWTATLNIIKCLKVDESVLGRDDLENVLRAIVSNELSSKHVVLWAVEHLRSLDCSPPEGQPCAPKSKVGSLEVQIEKIFETCITRAAKYPLHQLMREMATVNWDAVSASHESRIVVELFRDVGPPVCAAILQLLFQIGEAPHCLIFEDMITPLTKHILKAVAYTEVEGYYNFLLLLANEEFDEHINTTQGVCSLDKGIPQVGCKEFEVLDAELKWVVVDEIYRIALFATPRRLLVKIAIAWLSIASHWVSMSSFPEPLKTRYQKLIHAKDVRTRTCFERIARISKQSTRI